MVVGIKVAVGEAMSFEDSTELLGMVLDVNTGAPIVVLETELVK